jgi:hypothetical protein
VTSFTPSTATSRSTISPIAARPGATNAMTASRPVGTAFQRVDPAQHRARPVFGSHAASGANHRRRDTGGRPPVGLAADPGPATAPGPRSCRAGGSRRSRGGDSLMGRQPSRAQPGTPNAGREFGPLPRNNVRERRRDRPPALRGGRVWQRRRRSRYSGRSTVAESPHPGSGVRCSGAMPEALAFRVRRRHCATRQHRGRRLRRPSRRQADAPQAPGLCHRRLPLATRPPPGWSRPATSRHRRRRPCRYRAPHGVDPGLRGRLRPTAAAPGACPPWSVAHRPRPRPGAVPSAAVIARPALAHAHRRGSRAPACAPCPASGGPSRHHRWSAPPPVVNAVPPVGSCPPTAPQLHAAPPPAPRRAQQENRGKTAGGL